MEAQGLSTAVGALAALLALAPPAVAAPVASGSIRPATRWATPDI